MVPPCLRECCCRFFLEEEEEFECEEEDGGEETFLTTVKPLLLGLNEDLPRPRTGVGASRITYKQMKKEDWP